MLTTDVQAIETFHKPLTQLTPEQPTETEEEYYAEISRRLADVKAGKNIVYHELIEVAD